MIKSNPVCPKCGGKTKSGYDGINAYRCTKCKGKVTVVEPGMQTLIDGRQIYNPQRIIGYTAK